MVLSLTEVKQTIPFCTRRSEVSWSSPFPSVQEEANFLANLWRTPAFEAMRTGKQFSPFPYVNEVVTVVDVHLAVPLSWCQGCRHLPMIQDIVAY